MTSEKLHILSNINTLDTDYRAEVVVAGLIASGQEEEKTFIVRQGGNTKDIAKDVSKVATKYSGVDLLEYLYVYTNRYSVYDSLPEGIFHQSENRKRQKTQQDILGEIRGHRVKELHARKFFQPFEMAVDQLLIDAQIYEQKFEKAYLHDNLKLVFEDHWDILKYLSLKQGLLFIRTIPIISEASQSFERMAAVMSVILDCPVKIEEGKLSYLEVTEEERIGLGTMKLGINSVMGKIVQTDNLDLDIIIGPTSAQQVRDFQANKDNQIILDKLIEMIIPFDRNTNIKYEVFESEKKFQLSSKTHKAYLGVNTTL